MPRTPQDVTDAELAVLSTLWEFRLATVRQLTEQIYPKGSGSDYATVQKLLERLEAKRFVRRDRTTWPHVYRAAVAREDLIGRQLQSTADKLCEGSLTPLLTHLMRASQLSREERESLRDLLDGLDEQGKRGKSERAL